MENSFPQRGRRQRETLPATVRSRVPTTNLLMTRCVSWLWWVTLPSRLLPAATRLCWRLAVALVLLWAVNKLSQSRLTACVLNKLPLCAADQHHLRLASKLGNRRRQNTISSPKTVFVNSYHTPRQHEPSAAHTSTADREWAGERLPGVSLFQQKKEHILPMTPLRSQEEFEAGKGPMPLRRETHHRTGEVGFPQRKSWCAHPARGLCVLRDVTLRSGRFRRGAHFLLLRGVPL